MEELEAGSDRCANPSDEQVIRVNVKQTRIRLKNILRYPGLVRFPIAWLYKAAKGALYIRCRGYSWLKFGGRTIRLCPRCYEIFACLAVTRTPATPLPWRRARRHPRLRKS